jgi:hypothetical protein
MSDRDNAAIAATSSASYQRIREQLVALQVDVEDKDKVCQALRQRIEVERAKLARIEVDATQVRAGWRAGGRAFVLLHECMPIFAFIHAIA